MRKFEEAALIYDYMPKPDVKVPPIRETRSEDQDAQRLVEQPKQDTKVNLLSSLNFG